MLEYLLLQLVYREILVLAQLVGGVLGVPLDLVVDEDGDEVFLVVLVCGLCIIRWLQHFKLNFV